MQTDARALARVRAALGFALDAPLVSSFFFLHFLCPTSLVMPQEPNSEHSQASHLRTETTPSGGESAQDSAAASRAGELALGHVLALLTVAVWGVTFVSTKVLLAVLTPVEILCIRFVLGYVFLWVLWPRRMGRATRAQEKIFFLAGLSGICLYYLVENIALVYTRASNVGVIVCLSPFFTAILGSLLARFQGGGERLGGWFFAGLVISLAGVALICWGGEESVEFNWRGDLLAACAGFVWAVYSLLVKRITAWGFAALPVTRRIFFWGIVCMVPVTIYDGFDVSVEELLDPVVGGNLVFLGLVASALCFVFWSMSVKALGALASTVYIYLVPVITVGTAIVVLDEPFTPMVVLGMLCVIAGLVCAQAAEAILARIRRK